MSKRRHGNAREQTEWEGQVCCGKVIYRRRKLAKTVAAFCRAMTGDANIVPFRCRIGHHFHIGHDRPYEERKARRVNATKPASLKQETELDYAAVDH